MNSVPLQYATASDGVRIAYVSLGDGPPIVWASNIFGEATGYCLGLPHVKEVTDRLVGLGWLVIRYDIRGMAGSDRNVEDLSLEGRVRDLGAVVGHLGLDRFALGGLDVGAATAVAYALRHPSSVSHLILLSPWASGARYLAIPEPLHQDWRSWPRRRHRLRLAPPPRPSAHVGPTRASTRFPSPPSA